jgi:iron-sulfur cluster repair protein YtfE (RIC family)
MALTQQELTERQVQRDRVAQQTRDEFDDLLAAMHRLEQALAGAAPGREAAWLERVDRLLTKVEESLQRHVTSAEAPDGLFVEVDLARPTLVRRMDKLRHEHADLLNQAKRLRQIVAGGSFTEVRRHAAELLTALRHHQALETDLIFESFATDIGVGD